MQTNSLQPKCGLVQHNLNAPLIKNKKNESKHRCCCGKPEQNDGIMKDGIHPEGCGRAGGRLAGRGEGGSWDGGVSLGGVGVVPQGGGQRGFRVARGGLLLHDAPSGLGTCAAVHQSCFSEDPLGVFPHRFVCARRSVRVGAGRPCVNQPPPTA